jgi:glutamine transport system permease protein
LVGASVTLGFSIATIFFGSILGGIACFLTLSEKPILNKPARAYIQFIRGTPLLVQLLWIYYGMPLILGIALPAIVSGIIGMSLNAGAYISEIFRSGILAVEHGQYEAARSIGMSRAMTFRRIVAPQAFRIIVPPLANMFIGIVKDTSLVSVIAVSELVRRGQLLAASTFRTMEIFTGVAVIYFCMTYILARIAIVLEKKYSRGIHPRTA